MTKLELNQFVSDLYRLSTIATGNILLLRDGAEVGIALREIANDLHQRLNASGGSR